MFFGGELLNFGGVVSLWFFSINLLNGIDCLMACFFKGPLNKNTFIFQGVVGFAGMGSKHMEANHL